MTKFELVEIDPETGEVDQVLSPRPTTFAAAARHMDNVIAEVLTDWEDEACAWSWLRVQPAE